MTNIAQFKVKPGTTIIEGKATPQGLGVAWWTNTKIY